MQTGRRQPVGPHDNDSPEQIPCPLHAVLRPRRARQPPRPDGGITRAGRAAGSCRLFAARSPGAGHPLSGLSHLPVLPEHRLERHCPGGVHDHQALVLDRRVVLLRTRVPRATLSGKLVKSISSSNWSNPSHRRFFPTKVLCTRGQQRAAAWRPGTRLVLRGHEEAGVVEEAELLLRTRHPLRLGERGEGRDVSG